ncbi:MAG: MoxR family ATPase [Candidatus Promineifilaceae bacterium]|nr:MoxR family ATPase [Candidatus Promineifilaceae bacterium]
MTDVAIDVQEVAGRIVENVERVIVGKRVEVQLTVLGLLCQGHLLIEDVPGVGKTVMAKSLARSVGCSFQRIQFTPDLLPSDITGVSIFSQKTREFEFRPGPVHAQIVLVDEINRATPKTQSALLEAMEERQVTVDGKTYTLERPFMVLATQNPIEYEGTFPLPEAQLDRFLLRIRLGYPEKREEITILNRQQYVHPVEEIGQVVTVEELLAAQQAVKDIYVDDKVKEYIVDLVRRTRSHPDVYLGASSRGALAIFRLGQARAAMLGRDYVLPDDVKALVEPALAHRIIIGPAARIKDVEAEAIIEEIRLQTPVPGAQVATPAGARGGRARDGRR